MYIVSAINPYTEERFFWGPFPDEAAAYVTMDTLREWAFSMVQIHQLKPPIT